MTLVLNNQEIEALLPMADCLPAVEASFRDLGNGQAVNRPRSDMYSPTPHEDARYVFKSMDGSLPRLGVMALRLNSDVIRWRGDGGGVRKSKVPAAGGRWVGLILLFSHETGEPLAIVPDGVIQRLRVGATNALAARELAADDASIYGLIGAGWQAGAQLMAMALVRQLREVRVYSPTPERREAFAAEMWQRLELPVHAVDTPEEAIRGAQILGTATPRPRLGTARHTRDLRKGARSAPRSVGTMRFDGRQHATAVSGQLHCGGGRRSTTNPRPALGDWPGLGRCSR